jgi:hypothetical protein
MEKTLPARLFPVFVALAVGFVWLTSRQLPEVVASHFGAGGAADGFASRGTHMTLMLALLVGLPLLLIVVPNWLLRRGGRGINLPHREYWLAPQRRETTIAYLNGHFYQLGYLLVAFLTYVHWLVVRANAVKPPQIETAWIYGGVAVLLISMTLIIVALVRRFSYVPDK